MFKKIFLILLVTPFVLAKLERVQEEGVSIKRYAFKEVCNSFGVKDALLVEKKDTKTIDCMGKDFLIEKFCLNKFEKVHNYTKARFDSVESNVNCYFSETVILSVVCDKKHGHYCKDPKKGCSKLSSNFARNLSLSKSMLLEKYPMTLKCFYSSKSILQ